MSTQAFAHLVNKALPYASSEGELEPPTPPLFLAYSSDRPACEAVAKTYESLQQLDGNKKMTTFSFVGSANLLEQIRLRGARQQDIVLMYERPGTSVVWYTEHQASSRAPEIAWTRWVWGVGINPLLHERGKIAGKEQAAKSIRAIYGQGNFRTSFELGKLPWGAHPEDIALKVKNNARLCKQYFKGAFSTPDSIKIEGFAGI